MLYPAPEICILLIFQTIQKNCVKLCKWLIISIGFQMVLCLTTLQRENRWTCLRFLFMSTTQSMMVLSPIGECVCECMCVCVCVCVFPCECVSVLLLHHCCSFLSLYFSSLTLLLSGRHGVCVFHSSDHGNNWVNQLKHCKGFVFCKHRRLCGESCHLTVSGFNKAINCNDAAAT